MELFTNASREHLVSIIEEFMDQTFEKYDGSISDVICEFHAIGFTRQEILDVLNKRFLDGYDWEEETKSAPELAPAVEEVSVGDSDQAILETALTQIGIEYEFHKANGDNWIEILTPCNYSVEFLFNDKGDFLEVSC